MTTPITHHNIRTSEPENLTLVRDCSDRMLAAIRRATANAESRAHENRYGAAEDELVDAANLITDCIALYRELAVYHESAQLADFYRAQDEDAHGL